MSQISAMEVVKGIEQADEYLIYEYLDAVCDRFRELFPGWEMAVHNLNLSEDEDAQIDRSIAFLQGLKNFHPITIPKPTPPEEAK